MPHEKRKKSPVSIYLPKGLLAFMDDRLGECYASRSDYVADLIRKDMEKFNQP